MVSRNHWIGVVSRAQVQIGVKGGSIQLNHGKKAPLEKLRAGDALVMYSPRTEYPDGELLQAFTASNGAAHRQAFVHQDQNALGRSVPFRSAQDPGQ
jgi:hypothetical protein